MQRNRKIVPLWIILILSLFFINSNLPAQNQINNSEIPKLVSFFVKPEIEQNSGELSFNVINIINPNEEPVQFKPYLSLPPGWTYYSSAIKDTVINPGDTIRMPFRLKMPIDASSEITHTLTFQGFSNSNQLLIECSYVVKTIIIHDWKVEVPTERIFFNPRENLAQFEVLLTNNGNTTEAINLDFQIDNKIELTNADGSVSEKLIYLKPNSDTLIKLKANYIFSNDKVFDLSKIMINANTEDSQTTRSVLIEKYKDTYAPLHVDETLPQRTELGVRFNSDGDDPALFLRARGNTVFKNESKFEYNYSNYDLTEKNAFLENSFYNFLYTRNALKIGVGSFSSSLGRNLYSQNGVMFSNSIKLSKSSNMEIFADQDFYEPITSAALGYGFKDNKLKMHGSAAYNVNQYLNFNTASVILNSGTIPLFRDHNVSGIVYGYREDYYYAEKYHMMGYAWDLNYNGWLGKRISFKLTDNFGSPNIPGAMQGLLNNSLEANYYLGSFKKYINVNYFNTRRNYYYYISTDTSVTKQPNIYLYNQYGSVLYNNHSGGIIKFSLGPSLQFYKSRKPINQQGTYEDYQIKRFAIEANAEIGYDLNVEAKVGYRNIYYQLYNEFNLDKYEFHFIADYSKNGYGLRLAYDYGPLVNTGLYQTATDFDYNGINVSPYIFRNYLRGRFNVQLFSNVAYRFDLDYGYLNIAPKIQTYLAKNWYFIVGGNYGYYMQNSPEQQFSKSIYYAEVSIRKDWGVTDYMAWQKKLRRLKIILFQDDNGNGVKDEFEKGIPYVKTRLKLTIGSDQTTSGHFPVDIALLSNEKGTVIYNQIPQGFYELEINPLTDVGEYFYVNKTNKEINIVKNTTVYIPFQKADRIDGRVEVVRTKFIKEGTPLIDLSNIKVTAYNNSGNSYSSFTREDGSFVIFVPGDTTYLVRMQNVFGSNFIMQQNDISVKVPDPYNTKIIFKFVEKQRDVKLKKAEPGVADSLRQTPQKVKILNGQIYENAKADDTLKNAVPDFNLSAKNKQKQVMQKGKFYLILGSSDDIVEALKIKKIMDENGMKSTIGTTDGSTTYYIFSNQYNTRTEAQIELDILKKSGNKQAYIKKIE